MRSWTLAHVRVQEQQKQRCYVTTSTPSPTTNGKGSDCSSSTSNECNVTERALRSASVCVAVCWWAAAGSGQRASYFITGFQLNKICGASTSPAWFTLNATQGIVGAGEKKGEWGAQGAKGDLTFFSQLFLSGCWFAGWDLKLSLALSPTPTLGAKAFLLSPAVACLSASVPDCTEKNY